jgi:hypothetical protein
MKTLATFLTQVTGGENEKCNRSRKMLNVGITTISSTLELLQGPMERGELSPSKTISLRTFG